MMTNKSFSSLVRQIVFFNSAPKASTLVDPSLKSIGFGT